MATERSDFSQAHVPETRTKASVSEITAEIIGQPRPTLATIGKRASRGMVNILAKECHHVLSHICCIRRIYFSWQVLEVHTYHNYLVIRQGFPLSRMTTNAKSVIEILL